jgi:hypothetical protein
LTGCFAEVIGFDGDREGVVATMLSTLIIRAVEAVETPR